MNPLFTSRAALELVEHEAIVRECYLDSVNVWTWGIGVTNASGHNIDRYKDAPQTIEHCLEVYLEILRAKYLPAVEKAFSGYMLKEHELAAALSFHYNTGAIGKTDWVHLAKIGQRTAARNFLETHYLNGGDLTKRRKAEASLFFDGKWAGDGRVLVYPVRKPSYHPDFAHPQIADIREDMEKAFAA
jgi:lysozyme